MSEYKIKEIIVVEGRNDTLAIQRAVQADTIETRGSAIGDDVLREIRRAQQSRGVIIFTDPDYAGERIRRIISKEIPGVKHAFLPQHLARGKRKIGIEHASVKAIRQALESVRTEWVSKEENVPLDWEEYCQLGFAFGYQSGVLRKKVAEALGIGYGNAKQFYRRLCVLQITRDELFNALDRVRKDANE